jgi:hypothetical protein
MNQPRTMRFHVSMPSTKANARALAKLAASPRVLTAARVDTASTRRSVKAPPNPLWVIAIAMAAFFGATALMMLV